MNKFKGIEKMVGYMCKYLGKHLEDERLKGYKSYLRSQGLKIEYKDMFFSTAEKALDYLKGIYKHKMDNKKLIPIQDGLITLIR